MTDAKPSFKAGDRVGRFLVLGVLGSGSTGVVLLAEQPVIGRKVALKLLARADPEGVARFEDEARKLALLDHPNIVELYSIGEHRSPAGDALPFMVMEYVEGRSLGDLAAPDGRGGRRISAPVLLRIAATVARALEHAHARGVIHRDLKPDSVVVAPSGEPVLCDFSPSPLVTGDVELDALKLVGTPGFMSPEQARGEDVSPRTDVWGLGATLFALLAGRAPYEAGPDGEGAPGLVRSVASDRPLDLSPLEGKAPPCVAALVERCLRKDPDERYGSAESLRRAAEAAIDFLEASNSETVILSPPRAGETLLLHVEHREGELRGKFREYEIESYVGGGAFGDVYRACERLSGKTVALKVLRQALSSDGETVARFRREATLLSRVDHPNVVKLLGYGRYGGSFFIAMDFLEGETLDDVMGDGRRMELGEAAGMMDEILSGLAAVHETGVVHRDLKPGNVVLVGVEGRAVLCDFGLATAPDAGRVTSTGLVLGSPSYMAPETALGEVATSAADVYAAGVVLYEMLAGRLPHDGMTTRKLLRSVAYHPPEPIERWRPDLAGEVLELLTRMLVKDPSTRPSAREAGEALAAAVETTQRGASGLADPST